MAAELSNSEQVFALRMLPHLQSGMSFEDAARAVIEDDARIFAAFCERSCADYVSTPDERGTSYRTRVGTGDVIASEISRTVYETLRRQHDRAPRHRRVGR